MSLCANCGTPLAPNAQFCSHCGTPAVAVVPTSAPAPAPQTVQPKRSTWWIVPLVIVGLVLVAWLLLIGLPFGREKEVVARPATETIAEGTATAQPAPTGTIVDVSETAEPPFMTETAPPPPIATQTVPPVVTQTQPAPQPLPAPVIVEDRPAPQPIPRPAEEPRGTPRTPEEPRGEITEGEASAVLRGHLASNNPYDVASNCLQVRSGGYRNVGYTFSVWDSCVSGGGSRMLGRWRVDSKTREVFRQRDDGRYLRP